MNAGMDMCFSHIVDPKNRAGARASGKSKIWQLEIGYLK
jgi:hypothetical protein